MKETIHQWRFHDRLVGSGSAVALQTKQISKRKREEISKSISKIVQRGGGTSSGWISLRVTVSNREVECRTMPLRCEQVQEFSSLLQRDEENFELRGARSD